MKSYDAREVTLNHRVGGSSPSQRTVKTLVKRNYFDQSLFSFISVPHSCHSDL